MSTRQGWALARLRAHKIANFAVHAMPGTLLMNLIYVQMAVNDFTQHKFRYRVSAIVSGAAFGVWLSLLVYPAGGFFILFGAAVFDIVVGLWVHNDIRGLVRASHVGEMHNIALWTVLGGMAGGACLFIPVQLDSR